MPEVRPRWVSEAPNVCCVCEVSNVCCVCEVEVCRDPFRGCGRGFRCVQCSRSG